MEKHHVFSIWYVLLGIWIVLLIQNYFASTFSIRTLPYSEFLRLLKENEVMEVAITENKIQGKMKVDGAAHSKGERFETVRVDPEISNLLEMIPHCIPHDILRHWKKTPRKLSFTPSRLSHS